MSVPEHTVRGTNSVLCWHVQITGAFFCIRGIQMSNRNPSMYMVATHFDIMPLSFVISVCILGVFEFVIEYPQLLSTAISNFVLLSTAVSTFVHVVYTTICNFLHVVSDVTLLSRVPCQSVVSTPGPMECKFELFSWLNFNVCKFLLTLPRPTAAKLLAHPFFRQVRGRLLFIKNIY